MPYVSIIQTTKLEGTEPMPGLDATVLDFWRWSFSDLLMNTARGVLVEFIVARTLGISTDGLRPEWNPFDLITDDGIRIEVKSAAFIQSWAQRDYSTIQFGIAPRRAWDPETNTLDAEATRHADVYVFVLLAEKDQDRINPTDAGQWRFWIASREFLDARDGSQQSIDLASLKREVHANGPKFEEIRREVSTQLETLVP